MFLSHRFCPESIFKHRNKHCITPEPEFVQPSIEAGLIYPALVMFIIVLIGSPGERSPRERSHCRGRGKLCVNP